MERLEETGVRPRQVRYQAALRPDCIPLLILDHFYERHHGGLPALGANCLKTRWPLVMSDRDGFNRSRYGINGIKGPTVAENQGCDG